MKYPLIFCSIFIWMCFGACTQRGQTKGPAAAEEYKQRVEIVRSVPGLAAFWDFVQREDGIQGKGSFVATTDVEGQRLFPLVPHNISRDFWNDGEEATLA